MKITKRSDLYREYARVIDMCEGTKVRQGNCVKHQGSRFVDTPEFEFTGHISDYKFALVIVEDRPVFIGDELYRVNSFGCKVVIVDYSRKTELVDYKHDTGEGTCHISQLSWNPPKPKTFNLNGVELPLPYKKPKNGSSGFGFLNDAYYFDCEEDRVKVFKAITDLLSGSSIDNKKNTFNMNGVELIDKPKFVATKSSRDGVFVRCDFLANQDEYNNLINMLNNI